MASAIARNTLSAMILSGGASSRMGQDKAWVCVDGVPLLQRTCAIAQACAQSVVVVTRWESHRAIAPVTCDVLLESEFAIAGAGPLVAFAQAFPRISTEWVLLLACDLPALQAAIVQRWMTQWDGRAIALLPRTGDRWEPLCGFYHRDCLPSLQACVAQGERSFQRWLASIAVQAIAMSDDAIAPEQAMLFNCNTPQDLAQIPPQY